MCLHPAYTTELLQHTLIYRFKQWTILYDDTEYNMNPVSQDKGAVTFKIVNEFREMLDPQHVKQHTSFNSQDRLAFVSRVYNTCR